MLQKLQKENIGLPPIIKNNSLDFRKQKYIIKPKLSRIIYPPICSPQIRLSKQMHVFEAFTNKRSYEEILDEMKEREIEKYLRETKIKFNEKDCKNGMSSNRSSLNKEAELKYYQNYKKLDKLANRKKLVSQSLNLGYGEDDPSIGALQETQNMGILPCCMGLVKTSGDSSVLKINGHKFGDKYISAISEGLKQAKLIEKCELSNNRLTDKGFNDLLKNIGSQITKLDVSKNNITKIDQKLLSLVIQPEARLEYLNLQGNLISDATAQSLFRSASYSKHLKYLNLRKNVLTNKCAQAVSELLQRSPSLEQLYIGMNRIYDQGAIVILQSLSKNKHVKVFDYCLNNLGQGKFQCAKNIASMLVNNKTLLHVDFSENNFGEEESRIIGEGLEKNKKIYGFHFAGNYGYIDSKGFLRLEQKDMTSLHSIVYRNINSYDIVFRRQNTSFQSRKFKNVCWICEGWYEQVFRFNVPEPSADGSNLVFIHFDFEEYQPRLINLTQTNVKYKTMVPPKKYRYFFTWNKQQFLDKTILSQSQKNIKGYSKPVNKLHEPKQIKIDLPSTYKYEMNYQMIQFTVKQVTMRVGKAKKIVDNWDQLVVSVIPRQIGLITKKQKIIWTYKDSIWAKQWRLDDDQLIKNCFEKDWKNSKLMNFVKSLTQQQKVKEILYKNYRLIKEIYRYYTSWNPFNGDIWAVSNNAFTEFCHQSKIISKDTPLKIIDLTFITTNSMSGADWKGNGLVPERGLIRFQFMESIVRLAEEKFKKNGLSDSILGSVDNMINDNILPMRTNPNFLSEQWRLTKYFIEENDILLKRYRPIFNEIYRKNSRMKVKPGNKAFMCLTQFKTIFERIGVAGTLVLERDIFISFNCSMMTQIDEIENQKFIRMTEIQFIQAVARCAFILPDSCKIEDIFDNPLPFHAKFQWIIHELKTLCSDDLKSQFPGGMSLFNKNDEDED